MKKLHLICNAHLDPIWQWTWDEGISSVVATFKSAVDLAQDFDYIFCHGESLLYEALEKNAPEVFEKVRQLVACGKWRITSGWYLQPDCNMPSGESIVRQIKVGNKYFAEKFGIQQPSVATSFDAFGHNVGLVQILAKCGYKGYMVCRPKAFQFDYPGKFFKWVGNDGSSVIATFIDSYNSLLGKAVEKIKYETTLSQDVDYILWGVGNHGGGPSRKDLADIQALQVDGVEYVHSYPEKLFADNIKISGEVRRSLTPAMPGCYSSMARVKQAHREAENLFYSTEKMLAIAKLNGFEYDDEMLCQAQKKLLLAQFHDTLPGTVVVDGEKEGVELLSFSKKVSKDYRTNAFLHLVIGQQKAGTGEYPIFVFNYMPYQVETPLEAEISLADTNWSEEYVYQPQVFDEDGNLLVSQQIKEESTINLDWRKKVVFFGKLKPLSITRFTIKTQKVALAQSKRLLGQEINLDDFLQNSNSLLKQPLQMEMYDDSADPWGMSGSELHCMGNNPKRFRSMTRQEASAFCGVADIAPVHVVEDGNVVTCVEQCLTQGNTNAVIQYKTYKNQPYTDVKVTVEFADKNKLVRLKIPANKGVTVGDGMYVVEQKTDGEITFQKWVGKRDEKGNVFAVINDCLYAGKFDDEFLYLTLIRGAGYCFHPILERDLYPQDRYLPRIDCGRYEFNLRLFSGNVQQVCKEAELFNQKPYAINVFPTGNSNKNGLNVSVDNDVVLSVCKDIDSGLLVRLFNPADHDVTTTLCIANSKQSVQMGKGEIVSVVFNDGQFTIYHDEIVL